MEDFVMKEMLIKLLQDNEIKVENVSDKPNLLRINEKHVFWIRISATAIQSAIPTSARRGIKHYLFVRPNGDDLSEAEYFFGDAEIDIKNGFEAVYANSMAYRIGTFNELKKYIKELDSNE